MKPFWIVTRATSHSTLGDICFECSVHDFALTVRGGLLPEEIVDWFDNAADAERAAVQELARVAVEEEGIRS